MNRLISILTVLVIAASARAQVSDTLKINRGLFQLVDTTFMPYMAFNSTDTFQQRNHLIRVVQGDVLELIVINNDTVQHGFALDAPVVLRDTLSPGDTGVYNVSFPSIGSFVYYDHLNFPVNQYMGLSGMVAVRRSSGSHDFFWNLKEHEKSMNAGIDQGGVPNWSNYDPDYFTINSLSNPFINEDSTSRIVGQVGDTVYLYISNTGRSIHSIHFHGFHELILFSSKFPNQINWFKDSFPVYPMETLVLRIIPDKEGEYPVHDHNLVAVTSGNIYPNGMFSTMLISP